MIGPRSLLLLVPRMCQRPAARLRSIPTMTEFSSERNSRLYEEILRTIFAFSFFITVGYTMTIIQLLGDERLIALGLTKMQALPDLGFDLVPHPHWFPSWGCEIPLFALIISSFLGCIISSRSHNGGFMFILIYVRRFLWLLGLCYLFRLFALGGTTLPSSDPKCVFYSRTFTEYFTYAPLVIFGQVETCTDKLFSGHTTVAMLLSWFWIASFWTKSSFFQKFIARFYVMTLVAALIATLLMSRGHYTVDMVLAIIISTLVFHIFHLVLWIKEGMDRGNKFFSVRYGAGPTEVCRMHHLPDALLSDTGLVTPNIYHREVDKPVPPLARAAFDIVGWMEGLDIRN